MDKAKLKSLLISSDTTIKQAMQKLNETAEKILFVVDEKNRLLGTATDGDIRRGIINNAGFQDSIEGVIQREFTAIKQGRLRKKSENPIFCHSRENGNPVFSSSYMLSGFLLPPE